MAKKQKAAKDLGSYVVINGKRGGVTHHETDFTVMSSAADVDPDVQRLGLQSRSIASKMI